MTLNNHRLTKKQQHLTQSVFIMTRFNILTLVGGPLLAFMALYTNMYIMSTHKNRLHKKMNN